MDEQGFLKTLGDIFLNWQVLLISFGAFAVLGVVRKMGTKYEGDKETNQIIGGFAQHRWFKTFLPVYPYLLAGGLCFVPGIPLPDKVGATVALKLLYGIYAGWLSDKSYQLISSFVYKIIKKVA